MSKTPKSEHHKSIKSPLGEAKRTQAKRTQAKSAQEVNALGTNALTRNAPLKAGGAEVDKSQKDDYQKDDYKAFLVLVIASVLLAGVVSNILTKGYLFQLDFLVNSYGWKYQAPSLEYFMDKVVLLGQRGVIGPLAFIMMFFLSKKEKAWQGLYLLGLGTLLLNFTIGASKILTGRPVPRDGDMLLFVNAMGFPSGHASNMIVTYFILAYVLYKKKSSFAYAFTLFSAFISLLVGIATIYLETHWLSDLLAGWLVGVVIVSFVIFLDKNIPNMHETVKRVPVVLKGLFKRKRQLFARGNL